MSVRNSFFDINHFFFIFFISLSLGKKEQEEIKLENTYESKVDLSESGISSEIDSIFGSMVREDRSFVDSFHFEKQKKVKSNKEIKKKKKKKKIKHDYQILNKVFNSSEISYNLLLPSSSSSLVDENENDEIQIDDQDDQLTRLAIQSAIAHSKDHVIEKEVKFGGKVIK